MTLLACSGRNVETLIQQAQSMGSIFAAIGALLTGLMVLDMVRVRRYGWTLLPAAVFLVFHPAWWMKVDADCGRAKVDLSLIFLTAFVGLFVAHRKWMAKLSA